MFNKHNLKIFITSIVVTSVVAGFFVNAKASSVPPIEETNPSVRQGYEFEVTNKRSPFYHWFGTDQAGKTSTSFWWSDTSKNDGTMTSAQDYATFIYELTVDSFDEGVFGIELPPDDPHRNILTVDADDIVQSYNDNFPTDEDGGPAPGEPPQAYDPSVHEIYYSGSSVVINDFPSYHINQGASGVAGATGKKRKGLCCFSSYMMVACYKNNRHLSYSELASYAMSWCESDGQFTGQGMYQSTFGMKDTRVNGNAQTMHNEIVNNIKSGKPVVFQIKQATWRGSHHKTHFMVIYGYDDRDGRNGGVYVDDPASLGGSSQYYVTWEELFKHNVNVRVLM